ncbi:MAG: metallophosphoesterase family protein [Sulfurimonas sp.]|nr:metallophosphoesterase family protein [Sulfurimonas sp.]
MKIFKKAIFVLIAIIIIFSAGRLALVTYDSYVFVPRSPYLVMQTQNSITIKWQSPEREIGRVEYGFFSDILDKNISDLKKTNKHSIKISGLQECTKYYYKVISKTLDIDNSKRSFKTLCKNSDKQLLWVIGDSGVKEKKQKKVYQEMLKYINYDVDKLDMWILLGDNAYKSGTQKQYNSKLFEPYKKLVKKLVPWAVAGKHDAKRWAFYNIWDFPTKGESGGVPSGDESFYSIDNANLHLVMLDSQTPRTDKNSKLANWLRKDLKANKKPWVVVAIHTPPYTDNKGDSSGTKRAIKRVREHLVPIFDEFGVDLVLSGHSHGYERSKLMKNHLGTSDTFKPKEHLVQDSDFCYTKPFIATKNSGTIYLVNGSASRVDETELKHPAMPFSFELMGSLMLEITPTTLNSKFLTIDGEIKDEFTIKKNNTKCEGQK